jgi:hypothetical protein
VFYTEIVVASKNIFGLVGFMSIDGIHIGANVCIGVGIKSSVYKGMMGSMQFLAQDGMGVTNGSSYYN